MLSRVLDAQEKIEASVAIQAAHKPPSPSGNWSRAIVQHVLWLGLVFKQPIETHLHDRVRPCQQLDAISHITINLMQIGSPVRIVGGLLDVLWPSLVFKQPVQPSA